MKSNKKLLNDELATLKATLLTTLDEGIFFSKLTEFVQKQMGEHKVKIFKSHADGATQLVAENGMPVQDAPMKRKGIGLAGHVARTKRAYFSNSLQRDPLMANEEIESGIEKELCVPVTSHGHVLATINIQSKDSARKFSEADVNDLREVLDELKSPLANMRLYLMAKNLNEELMKTIEQKDRELKEKSTDYLLRKESEEYIELAGHSSVFMELVDMVKKVAREDYPVLIEGQLGTGKRTLARKIHYLSDRRHSSYKVLNCHTEKQVQLEEEIFGRHDKTGALESSSGGTIIFCEVSELAEHLQRKLLSVLTSGQAETVDGQRKYNVNVRVVTTSKGSLENAVRDGSFLKELFFRLTTVTLRIPALIERSEDIKILSEHFLNFGRADEDCKVLTSKAIQRLSGYSWPGNVRELKNVIDGIRTMTEGKYIDADQLPKKLKEDAHTQSKVREEFHPITLHDLEKRHIMLTLDHLGGNKTRAAKSLGITVKTLYNKLHSYGVVQASNKNQ